MHISMKYQVPYSRVSSVAFYYFSTLDAPTNAEFRVAAHRPEAKRPARVRRQTTSYL